MGFHLFTSLLRSLRELQGTADYNAVAVQSVFENGLGAISLEVEKLRKRLQEDLEAGIRAIEISVAQHASQGTQVQKHWGSVSTTIKGVSQTLDSVSLPNAVTGEGKRSREQEEDTLATSKKARNDETE
jgi:hypothetical protein